MAKRAWTDWLWADESRVHRSDGYEGTIRGREPLLDAHASWNAQPPRAEGIKKERVGWLYARHGKW